mgnify:CR=1 FL=1
MDPVNVRHDGSGTAARRVQHWGHGDRFGSTSPRRVGVTAHPGATCNGLACGPNEFCIAAYPGAPLEFGVPTPRCVAVPQCLATPNCDCIAAAACGRADCRIQGDLVNCYLP